MEYKNYEYGCSCDGLTKCKINPLVCKTLMLERELYFEQEKNKKLKDLHEQYKIFYSHHLWKYNTEIETYEEEIIKRVFSNSIIINPSKDILQKDSSENIMKECLLRVKSCDIFIFSTLSGVIGKGVYMEIQQAINNNKRTYHIKNNTLQEFNEYLFKNIEIINENNKVYGILKCC